MRTCRYPLIGGMALAWAVAANAAIEPPDLQQVLKELRELREEQKVLRQTVTEQQRTIDSLKKQAALAGEKQKLAAEAMAALPPPLASAPGTAAGAAAQALAAPGGSSFRIGDGRAYMDISADVLVAGGWSSEPSVSGAAGAHPHSGHSHGDSACWWRGC